MKFKICAIASYYRSDTEYSRHIINHRKPGEIEKGKLLSIIPTIQKAGIEGNSPFSVIKDKRLFSILPTNSSKILDENGEPIILLTQIHLTQVTQRQVAHKTQVSQVLIDAVN